MGMWLRTVGYDCWLESLPKQGCRRGSKVVWILQSGLLDGQVWVLYSVLVGAMSYLSCLGRAAGWNSGRLFGDLNQARVYNEFPGQVKPPILLCRWSKPWPMLSVQMPLYIGSLNGLWSFLCAVVRCSGRIV